MILDDSKWKRLPRGHPDKTGFKMKVGHFFSIGLDMQVFVLLEFHFGIVLWIDPLMYIFTYEVNIPVIKDEFKQYCSKKSINPKNYLKEKIQ